jgi:uncharacterized membrane protein YdjX (TVP38/TMEM64 family)
MSFDPLFPKLYLRLMSGPTKPTPNVSHARWMTLAALLAIGLAALFFLTDVLKLENLARHETGLRSFGVEYPWLVYGMAFAIYVIVTGLSLPGASLMTLFLGWYFGFLPGVLLASFASTTGATTAFLMTRYLMHGVVPPKFGGKLNMFNENFHRNGLYHLFTLRLLVFVPFGVINIVMGLTPMKTRTFWWVSQLGMLPGTALYVYAGSTFPTLSDLAEKGARGILTPQIAIALIAVGLFPWFVKKAVLGLRNTKPSIVTGPADNESPD